MDDWVTISLDSIAAAKSLHADGHYRSCVSRSYFGAYAAVASALEGVIQYPDGREGPGHAALPSLIKSNLTGVSSGARQSIKQDIGLLYKARLEADYSPSASCDEEMARIALRAACAVQRELGLPKWTRKT